MSLKEFYHSYCLDILVNHNIDHPLAIPNQDRYKINIATDIEQFDKAVQVNIHDLQVRVNIPIDALTID